MVDDRMIVNQPYRPAPTDNKRVQKQTSGDGDKQKVSFENVLKDKLQKQEKLKFSRHAEKRMLSRKIDITDNDLQQLQKGVEKAESKGSRDSLIMVNKVAFLVSVENNTVVTAVDDENVKENVFTNIDSAVFM